jgi:hypothetical protein
LNCIINQQKKYFFFPQQEQEQPQLQLLIMTVHQQRLTVLFRVLSASNGVMTAFVANPLPLLTTILIRGTIPRIDGIAQYSFVYFVVWAAVGSCQYFGHGNNRHLTQPITCIEPSILGMSTSFHSLDETVCKLQASPIRPWC